MDMEDIKIYKIKLVSKEKSWLMKLIGNLLWFITPTFMDRFWTTLARTIYHPGPPREYNRVWFERYRGIFEHEMIHVQQWIRWGPLMWLLWIIFPLPLVHWGLWVIEREAYINDIRNGRKSIEEAVNQIWYGYGWPWPRFLMRRWFQLQLKKDLNAKFNI